MTSLEEKIGALEDSIKSLSKTPTEPPGAVDGDTNDPNCGYKHYGEMFCEAVQAADENIIPDRLKKLKQITLQRIEKDAGTGMEAGDAQFGGYLLPEGFRTSIWGNALEISNIMQSVDIIPTTTMQLTLPAMGGYDRSGGTVFGGITFYDEGENEQLQDVRPTLEQLKWSLDMQGAMTHLSDRMLRFSPISMQAFIKARFGEALAWRMEHLFLNGTGAGQPKGINNEEAKVEVSAETDQATDTVVYENIVKMQSHMWRPNNAQWHFNHDLRPVLKTMDFAVGTGGERLKMAEALEYPYSENEHCAAKGDAGDIVLQDWSQYGVMLPAGQADSPTFDTSMHFKFDYAQTSFRFMWYMDAHLYWRTYITPHYGSMYLTPTVTLAAR